MEQSSGSIVKVGTRQREGVTHSRTCQWTTATTKKISQLVGTDFVTGVSCESEAHTHSRSLRCASRDIGQSFRTLGRGGIAAAGTLHAAHSTRVQKAGSFFFFFSLYRPEPIDRRERERKRRAKDWAGNHQWQSMGIERVLPECVGCLNFGRQRASKSENES